MDADVEAADDDATQAIDRHAMFVDPAWVSKAVLDCLARFALARPGSTLALAELLESTAGTAPSGETDASQSRWGTSVALVVIDSTTANHWQASTVHPTMFFVYQRQHACAGPCLEKLSCLVGPHNAYSRCSEKAYCDQVTHARSFAHL
jgi:hypothetical protein